MAILGVAIRSLYNDPAQPTFAQSADAENNEESVVE